MTVSVKKISIKAQMIGTIIAPTVIFTSILTGLFGILLQLVIMPLAV